MTTKFIYNNNNNKRGFTLVEIAAVIAILLLLITISLPMLNKGSSHHEAKMVAHSIQALITLADQMANSAGKVYLLDTDISSSTTLDHDGNTRNILSVVRIYSTYWDDVESKVKYVLVDESLDIPVSIVATTNDLTGKNDHLYFKPDGQITTDITDISVWPKNNEHLFYRINIDQNNGSTDIVNFKD